MEMSRGEMVARLAGSIAAIERSHPTRVAIDGPDAAGKSTLADELERELRGRGRQVIRTSVDGFHRPRAERYGVVRTLPEGISRTPSTSRRFETSSWIRSGPGATVATCERSSTFAETSRSTGP